jgi:hypothetical protein
MKKFIYKTLLTSLPLLFLLIVVNYFGDAARLFDNDYEKSMAEIVSSGRYVTNFENYDEILFQKEVISKTNIKPELIVIGSSRTMLIRNELFRDTLFFNNSVSGASIEDLISIYQLYKINNKLPNKIIIGIDPWTFNENNNQMRWRSLSTYYHRFQNPTEQEKPSYFKYKELISVSYFQSSIKMIPRLFAGKLKLKSTFEKYNILGTKLNDGSLVYGERYRNATQIEINNKINSYLAGSIYSIEHFDTISIKIFREFEQLIADMKSNRIQIEFFLAPYAPLVFDKIQEKYPMVLKSEEIINNYAISNNIKMYGSFNPYILGMDSTFFYDGMHCKENGVERIIKIKK